MKTQLLLTLVFSIPMGALAVPVLLPNGDFEDALGPATLWTEGSGQGLFTFLYPETDGNPDGHVVIDNLDTGFGLLIANNNQPIPLSSLGLSAGNTYRFSQEMRFTPDEVLGGQVGTTAIGGMKVDFFSGNDLLGSTGDLRPDLIGTGDTWELYDFDIPIPAGVDGLKLALLWGPASTVSFDNVQVESDPLPAITAIPNGDFELPGGDSWGLNDDGGATLIDFPATGGSGDDGGYARIDATGGNFGVLISFSNQILPIAGLGLTAGQSYLFQQDMKLLSGTAIGGLQVEFYTFGVQHSTTGNLFPAASVGADWATYSFPVQIPPFVDGIKLVALAGPASSVGFDNFVVSSSPISTPPQQTIPNGDFSAGAVNWGTGGQPQTSFSFPASGGNGGGYARMTNSGSGFGVLIANAGGSISLGSLGLTPGSAYKFQMDTYRDAGGDVGKLKIEFFRRGLLIGNTGDLPAKTVTGAWKTDDFLVNIPAETDAIRVVPVAGFGSDIRFDNLTFNRTPFVAPPVANLDFENGSASWVAFTDSTSVTFLATGGSSLKSNPNGGYVQMNSTGGFGVIVANGNTPIALADLGLAAGTEVTLKMDMKIFANTTSVGKMKLEFFSGTAGGFPTDEQEITVDPIAPATDWQTYTFVFNIPTNIQAGGLVDRIKIVPIAAVPGIVGFDNIEILAPSTGGAILITASGFDSSGNFFLEVAGGVAGRIVTTSPTLTEPFVPAPGVTNDGANRFIIAAATLDANADGKDFFRIEEAP